MVVTAEALTRKMEQMEQALQIVVMTVELVQHNQEHRVVQQEMRL
jgi:hypothetical protein